VSFGYVCTRLIPVDVNNYQLQDEMKDEARFALVEHKDQYQIQQEVYQAARDLGIRASLDAIDVEPIEGGYRITLNYIVPLRILNHSFDLRFHNTANSSSI
jgi:hypothetical protein